MKFRTLRYYLREGVRSLIKNRLMSVASILTVASCIFIVSVFYCLAANIDYFLSQLESSIEITVFIDEALSEDEVIELSNKILAIPHVKTARYASKTDALNEFRLSLKDTRMLEGLDKNNPFRRSFNIEIDDLNYQEDVILALQSMEPEGVSNIRHLRDVANIALTVSSVVRAVCMVLIVILATISIVIITNTIRITVNARKTEINIMKYVGATDWFIRWPFVVEGVLIGLIGGLLPAVICWLGYNRVVAMIREGLPIINFIEFRPGYDIFAYLFPFAMFLGVLIGMIGSMFSIRRHLKV